MQVIFKDDKDMLKELDELLNRDIEIVISSDDLKEILKQYRNSVIEECIKKLISR